MDRCHCVCVQGGEDNVKVAVRCRPLSETERANGNTSIVKFDKKR